MAAVTAGRARSAEPYRLRIVILARDEAQAVLDDAIRQVIEHSRKPLTQIAEGAGMARGTLYKPIQADIERRNPWR